MAALTTTVVPLTGQQYDDLPEAATSGGDTCQTGKGVLLLVANASTDTDCDVTIATPGTVDGLAIADRVVTVAFGHSVAIPIGDVYRGSTGRASITYESATDISVAVIRVNA